MDKWFGDWINEGETSKIKQEVDAFRRRRTRASDAGPEGRTRPARSEVGTRRLAGRRECRTRRRTRPAAGGRRPESFWSSCLSRGRSPDSAADAGAGLGRITVHRLAAGDVATLNPNGRVAQRGRERRTRPPAERRTRPAHCEVASRGQRLYFVEGSINRPLAGLGSLSWPFSHTCASFELERHSPTHLFHS